MKPVYQTKFGWGGNCLASCLASIFEIELGEIPDLAPPECITDGSVQNRLLKQWLGEFGFGYLEIATDKKPVVWTSGAIPSCPCLFAVDSPSPELAEKGFGHFVVGQLVEYPDRVDYVVLHDPLGRVRRDYKLQAVGFIVANEPSVLQPSCDR